MPAFTGGDVRPEKAFIEDVLVGGNHLANILIGRLGGDFSTHWQPTMHWESARESIVDEDTFDVWVAWAAIMRLSTSYPFTCISVSNEPLAPGHISETCTNCGQSFAASRRFRITGEMP